MCISYKLNKYLRSTVFCSNLKLIMFNCVLAMAMGLLWICEYMYKMNVILTFYSYHSLSQRKKKIITWWNPSSDHKSNDLLLPLGYAYNTFESLFNIYSYIHECIGKVTK